MRNDWSRTTVAGLALAAVLAAGPAVAAPQGQIQETRDASPNMRLEIDEIVVGRVEITGWDRDEMQVTGRIGRDVTSVEIEGGPDRYEINVDIDEWDDDWDDWEGRRRDRDRDRDRDVEVELEVRVPHGASVQVEAVTAPIRVEGVHGRVDLETVTGTIEYVGEATVLELATVTGDIVASGAYAQRVQLETVQGDISWRGELARNARASFETVGGSVELFLPEEVSAAFDIETLMGEIETDFGVRAERVSRWMNSQELHFTAGDGSARVSIETVQGSVHLRRQ